jgi:hypothetical protein
MTTKEIPQHRDILDNTIKVGDCVAYPQANTLQIATVSKLNPKMVQIKRVGLRFDYTQNKYPKDLVVLNSKDVTMYLLKAGVK